MKKIIGKYPIAASVIITFLLFFIVRCVGFVWFLPINNYTEIVYEIITIIIPFVMVCIFGDKKIYFAGGFEETLTAGAFIFAVQGMFLFSEVSAAILSRDTKWVSISGIVLGVIMLFGVGFREESIFRGIIVNLIGKKYAKDRKGIFFTAIVSGLIFGMVHMTNIFSGVNPVSALVQSAVASGVGYYLAAVYLRGGNIWVLVLVHSVTDAASLFYSVFTADNGTVIDAMDQLTLLNLTPCFIFSALGTFLLRKNKCAEIAERFGN